MVGALAQTDQRDIRPLPGGHRPDVFDLDLARDHLVPERSDDRSYERQAILALVRDQNTEMLGFAVAHLGSSPPSWPIAQHKGTGRTAKRLRGL
jgi:hypothetical protein